MDRRRFRRWPRQLDVRVWKHGEEGQATRAISTNVSRTGIFVRTQLVLPSGTRLRVEVIHSARSFVSEGVVMRALKTPSHLQSVMPSGMGIRFLRTEELIEELLPGINLLAEERVPDAVGEHGRAQAVPVGDAPQPFEALTPPPAATPVPAAPAADPRSGAGAPIRTTSNYPLRFRDREQFKRAFERDISTGGLFISTDTPPPLDSVVEVEVHVEGQSAVVRLQGRVVHRMEPPPGSPPGNLLAGIGVQFLDVRRAVEQLRALL
jgi:uncharacterized protein (TIGR02266 family)